VFTVSQYNLTSVVPPPPTGREDNPVLLKPLQNGTRSLLLLENRDYTSASAGISLVDRSGLKGQWFNSTKIHPIKAATVF
jgi:hypothetical protein